MRNEMIQMEENIMACWQVEQDLDILLEYVMEGDLDRDRIANIVLGMKELSNLRFDKLFNNFERAVKEYYGATKNGKGSDRRSEAFED